MLGSGENLAQAVLGLDATRAAFVSVCRAVKRCKSRDASPTGVRIWPAKLFFGAGAKLSRLAEVSPERRRRTPESGVREPALAVKRQDCSGSLDGENQSSPAKAGSCENLSEILTDPPDPKGAKRHLIFAPFMIDPFPDESERRRTGAAKST